MKDDPRAARPTALSAFILDPYDHWHFERLGEVDQKLAQRIERHPEIRAQALDAFAVLYKPVPTLREDVPLERKAFARALLENPKLETLRRRTCVDEVAALTALRALLESLLKQRGQGRGAQGQGGQALLDAAQRVMRDASGSDGTHKALGSKSLSSTQEAAFQTMAEARDTLDPATITRPLVDKALHELFTSYEGALQKLATFDRQHSIHDRRPAPGEHPPRPLHFKRRGGAREPPSKYVGVPRETEVEREPLVSRVRHLRRAFEGAQEALTQERGSHDSRIIRAAIDAASQAVTRQLDVVDDVLQLFGVALGWSRGGGQGHRLPLHELTRLADMLQRHPDVRRIADLAGRIVEGTDAEKKTRSSLAKDEIVGVTRGGSLHDVLPAQLVGLRHPRLRRLTLARLVERTLLSRQLEGIDTKTQGPVICVVDTSGSMSGPRVVFAKAVALALALRAQRRRRTFYLLTFGGPGEVIERAMPRQLEAWPRFQQVVEIAFGGGTDFDGPLRRVAKLATEREWRQADAVFITDGDCSVDATTRDLLAKAHEATDLQLIEINVGGAAGLRGVADLTFDVDPLRTTAAPARLQEVLRGRL